MASPLSLPFLFTNPHGPFEMRWGFGGSGRSEFIEIEMTLPSDAWGGIGLGCETSRQCDMIVGNGCDHGGVFLTDFWEEAGSADPHTDVSLGGTDDVELIAASCSNYASTTRFRRLLNTGDKWDNVLTKGPTPIIYSWCSADGWCEDLTTPHRFGDWEIDQLNLSGSGHLNAVKAASNSTTSTCYAGSEDLCGCSELIRLGAIANFDECTQSAAIRHCEEFGPCYGD
jgi:hypothetical protein